MYHRALIVSSLVLSVVTCARGGGRGPQQAVTSQGTAPQVVESTLTLLTATDSVVVHGACPFECCQYGQWTLTTPADLRASPSRAAPVVRRLGEGTPVCADSGLVLVKPTGIVYALKDVQDSSTGFTLRQGDTLILLDELGEGYIRARLRDSVLRVSGWDLSPNNPDIGSGLKVLRKTGEQWWVHFTVTDSLAGWVLMNDVRVLGADACGS